MTRKEIVLKLIVEHFIKTAEPVGSQTLLDVYGLEYSSATIRNEMKELEEDGLIEKPHTSAGRVPSSSGYRYYVDNLRTRKLDSDLKYQLQQVFERRHLNLEEVIKEGCEIISQMTNLTVVMLGKSAQGDRLKDIQLVEISANSAMCVYVLESGEVATKKFFIPEQVPLTDIRSCVSIFRDRLIGTPLAEIGDKLEGIRPLVNDLVESYEVLFKTFIGAMLNYNSEKMSVFGVSNLVDQVEFASDLERLKGLMSMLENHSIWSSIAQDQHPLMIAIDKEEEALSGISIIKAQTPSAAVALVGPTRMDYDKVIEAFNFMQRQIEKLLKGGKDEKEE